MTIITMERVESRESTDMMTDTDIEEAILTLDAGLDTILVTLHRFCRWICDGRIDNHRQTTGLLK